MRIFVTGATGFVGSAVVQELIGAGHQVLGLTRSDEGAAALTSAGAEVHHGSLGDLASLRAGADMVDGIIHTAFDHDFSRFAENCELDQLVIQAFGDALKGSDRPLIVTSGLSLVMAGNVGTEQDIAVPASDAYPRASEAATSALAASGINASVVRLPPSVHGLGDHGFVPTLINIAREKGVSAYIGDGDNVWPAVHRLDAARVFRLAVENGTANGPFHAVAEQGVPFKAIAEVISHRLDIPVASKTAEEAEEHFGWFAFFAAMNVPTSSSQTRALLDWEPTQQGLIVDIDQPNYFAC